MFALSTYDLLKAWDSAQSYPSMDRALILLTLACPGITTSALAELSIGERNTHLMHLRKLMFGSQVQAVSRCPDCSEPVELEIAHEQLSVAPRDTGPLFVNGDGHYVEFRLPNSIDLAAVRDAPDVPTARRHLAHRCSSSIVPEREIPETLIEAISAAMEQADPQSEIRLGLNCPACAWQWEELFDIASFLWAELHAWSLRALRDVHQLAVAYGWREADILAMSPSRRQVYLEMTAG
jgi:hypothetical protein